MQVDTFANRLKKALAINNMTQTELSNKTKIDKSLISNYLSGNYKAKQDNLSRIAKALDVSETWLMGYDVDLNGKNKTNSNDISEIDNLLFSKAKELSDEDKIVVMNVIDSIKKRIDKDNL